jgi:hypothetical protein
MSITVAWLRRGSLIVPNRDRLVPDPNLALAVG